MRKGKINLLAVSGSLEGILKEIMDFYHYTQTGQVELREDGSIFSVNKNKILSTKWKKEKEGRFIFYTGEIKC